MWTVSHAIRVNHSLNYAHRLSITFRTGSNGVAGWENDRGMRLRQSYLSRAMKFSAYLQGTLAGFDQRSNVVLSNSTERVYSLEEGVEEVPLGLYLVKGDMM